MIICLSSSRLELYIYCTEFHISSDHSELHFDNQDGSYFFDISEFSITGVYLKSNFEYPDHILSLENYPNCFFKTW